MYVYTDRIAKYLKDISTRIKSIDTENISNCLWFCNHFKDRITYNFKETKELQSNSFFKYIFFACLCAN